MLAVPLPPPLVVPISPLAAPAAHAPSSPALFRNAIPPVLWGPRVQEYGGERVLAPQVVSPTGFQTVRVSFQPSPRRVQSDLPPIKTTAPMNERLPDSASVREVDSKEFV